VKLAQVREYALSLPEVEEAPHFHFSSFRIRGKMLVTVPPEETHIHIFVADPHREPALAAHPDFIEKLFWAGKVRGLRVALAKARQSIVKELIRLAWEAKAPKSLVGTTARLARGPST
jgi:hypothetical protein